ncbi:importin-13-like isoform X2 [Haliotis asinina]|uniref:importin-13-like isoform X2 n=1 Tax=Haliotis asinina TaxID=109174 RepID=UPI0035325072
MEFSAANVEQAVQQFYCNANLQQEVHQWLNSAQISPEAWSFCFELLAPEKGPEVQFFGASSLHAKISRYWHEVPSNQYLTLKQKLLEKIIQFADGPKMILTRLCVALSSYIMQTAPESWSDPVEDLITTFQREDVPNISSFQRCQILLDILTVIPEEFFGANLSQQRRITLRSEFQKGLLRVLPLLQGLLNPHSPTQVYAGALKCFSSWVDFGIPIIESETIILQVFQSIHNQELFETAVETLSSVFSHPESYRFPYTIQKLLPNILNLQDMMKRVIDEKDMETTHGLCRIVMSLAETHTKLIVESSLGENQQHKNNVNELIQMVLRFTSLPGHYPVDEACSKLSFMFWYILQDELQALDASQFRILQPIFHGIYFSLMEVLLTKVQYPNDQEYESWSSEEKEQFRCYRQDIGDTMMYAFNILREPLIGYLCNILKNLLQSQDIRWQTLEAMFFLFGSVAESVDLEETVYLPMLLEMLPRVPFNNIKLISTALYMIGSFGEWMNCHPDSLGCVIPLILQGLGNSEVATAATMALKDVTRENLDHIHPFAHNILVASQTVLEGNSLKPRDALRLMSCVGQVLSVLPFNDIMECLNRILTPHIQQFQQLVKEEQPTAVTKANLILKVNLLSWLFASLDTERDHDGEDNSPEKQKPNSDHPKPVYVVLQQVLPMIKVMVSKWLVDPTIVEAVCELFKKALRTLMEDFSPMSQDVAQMTIEMYQAVPHPSLLDLVRQMILLFGTDRSFEQFTKVLLSTIINKTLLMYQDVQVLRANSDVIENFMTLLSQVMKKTQHLMTDGSCNLSGLFHAGIIGMGMPEHGSVKSSCSFLIEFLHVGYEVKTIKDVIETSGHLLVDRILRAIGGESPRGVIENISDVLLALNKYHFPHLTVWLTEIINKEGYPSIRATKKDREKFVKNILREKVNKRKVRDLVKEFTLLCRGLLGTEYAAQAAAMI